ncbi:MAG: hypothetical protein JNL11_15245 [Bdellovibrionaceae bacterium]|nr:hypothetical protein [Pseudobdellovibrionaceae bacterium]
MTLLINFFLTLLFSTLLWADADPQLKKFEDLFIWKVSDELKLNQKEEVAVSEIIRETNKKKLNLNNEIESLYKKLKEEVTDDGRRNTFQKIREAHKKQLAVTLEELDRLKKTIGLKKVSLYLDVKRDVTDKIKNIWTQNERKSVKDLPPPKVIEEK